MRSAIFIAMWWTLLRDRGALIMGFVLPPIVFVIFATIFSATSGGELNVSVAIYDARGSQTSQRLTEALRARDTVKAVTPAPASPAEVTQWVRDGTADVGIVVRANTTPFGKLSDGPPPLLIIAEPSREIAAAGLLGALQAAYFQALPDAVVSAIADLIDTRIVPFQPQQKAALNAGLAALVHPPGAGSSGANSPVMPFTRLYERQDVFAQNTAPVDITYYAGAVAIMFLLFSASSSAITLIEERDTGLLQRVATGPGGTAVVVDGKFAFGVCQGLAQVMAIFLVAWLAFGVPITAHLGPWLATSFLAAFSASGLPLAFVSVCRSRQQAQSLGNFIILMMSALGGSMVPRFLMPEFIHDVGWLTPNTWVLEAYALTFWRPDGGQLVQSYLALLATGVAGLVIARWAAARAAGQG